MNIEQYQAHLAGIYCDVQRISLLERKSRARLQLVHLSNSFYIRSISDKYKHIRILILSLLIHIHRHPQQQHHRLLKSIIYQSQLELLTASHGLLKEELHKNVSAQLEHIQKTQDLENELIRCFNCVAFFDQVVVSSFAEYFNSNDYSSLEAWQTIIANSFQIQVHIIHRDHLASSLKECPLPKQHEDSIYLQMEGSNIYLPSNYRHSVETDRMSDRSVLSIQSIEVQHKHMDNILTVSIEDNQSPQNNKENCDNNNTKAKGQKISHFQPTLKPLQRSRRKKKSFWSILCCGSD